MEAFQLLARGVTFNKKKYEADISLFSNGQRETPRPVASGELPASLDFFKYAKGGTQQIKTSVAKPIEASGSGNNQQIPSKKRKRDMDDSDSEIEHYPSKLPHRVTTKGERVPARAETFVEMQKRFSIAGNVMRNLDGCGYSEPTAIQTVGIPILAEGRDLAAVSPTGTGKTLAYLLPIFARLKTPVSSQEDRPGVRAVIVAPTKELAGQIYNEAQKLAQGRKWRIVLFSKATAATLKDPSVRGKVDIIISTPMRLVASIQAGDIQLDRVQVLILDEADRLLDPEFASQVEEIVGCCSNPACQKAVFSATLPAKAEKTVLNMMNDPIRVVVGLKDTPLPNIKQSLVYVAQPESKLPTLIQYLTSPLGYKPPVIVFTSTQARATSLLSELLLAGVMNAEALHAGLTKHQREECVKRILKGEVWVLITTDVLARGMDFGGVCGVINFDWPESVQSYVHRIGRTGRAGREGTAITYFTDEDAPYLKSIANVLLQSGQSVPDWMIKLPKPSKMKRKQMGRAQREQPSVGFKGENVGRSLALRKKDMIAGSKRRAEKAEVGSEDEED
ncbi:ATP-dependent RNA helicase ROK1 [Serendipita indica DSM 11827]|uniref:RNA helicase n=1 Tax=Serendipita indica (strain DSM 11827) TaxID=1109443 RepID=G4TD78_SERID|nr:ATP-dependent RNA helicase ROK1 [Serendipita indica DSM 11827]CCA69293.1 probable ROK1-ATP-dependent RNA helicase [Serendipita indica DSM 11827]